MDQLKWFLTIAFSFSSTVFAETNTLSEDWFQIDTIIFEYLEPDTSENMGNGEKKYYPQNVIAIDENLKTVKEDVGSKSKCLSYCGGSCRIWISRRGYINGRRIL